MNQLIRIRILCFLRFSMPSLLIGVVLVGYSLYCMAVITPTFGDWTFGLGAFIGAGFAFVGIRSGLASISTNGVDSDASPEDL